MLDENLRNSNGSLTQQQIHFSCHAVVTSPMYWYWTECFVIGEYYLTEDDAVGWDTAERTCFDPDFKRGKLKFSSI